MESFLARVAADLYRKYGDGVSSLRMLFPSRRARLFFADALSRIADRPLWQPEYVTVDQLMGGLAGLAAADRVRMLTELYKIYSAYHTEAFDAFYFWGDMLLADFDQVDKYLIDADMLFRNIGDLKTLEQDYSYLTPEQVAIIEQFWRNFGLEGEFSDEKQNFLRVWQTLAPIYHEFRRVLAGAGVGYTGMIHREAVRRLEAGEASVPRDGRYVAVGFNALTACERVLLRRMQEEGVAEFYWDYDDYYVGQREQEAGLFVRENLRMFPPPAGFSLPASEFSAPKEVVAVAAPSDSLQCKYVYDFLQGMLDRGERPGKETAVVLTDENLLLPVLSSVPEGVESVNITMGYPLQQTLAYSFVERLMQLQARRREKNGRELFYHSDVLGLLGHPYVAESCGTEADRLAGEIVGRQQVYVDRRRLGAEGLIGVIFTPADDWRGQAAYLLRVLAEVARGPVPDDDAGRRTEFFTVIADQIYKLQNSLEDCGVEITTAVFASLLRKMLQGVRIPYEGEPLEGVQVMGILETRALDFENVVILSVNDDTFPGNRAAGSSFVPFNLRLAYGLPTPQHHEGVYAYYFYRLLQRARRVHLVYSSRSDDKRSGEPSRYIYQLRYESPHAVEERAIPVSVNLAGPQPIVVEKRGTVAEKLEAWLDNPDRQLSPTSFYAYLECPLKFYFRSVARLRPDEEISEEIDMPMFGTILHKAMELLYRPLVGKPHPGAEIAGMAGKAVVDEAIAEAIRSEYLRGDAVPEEEWSGNILLVRDIVRKYLNSCVLPWDAAHDGFIVRELERKIACPVTFVRDGRERTVWFGGLADRVDLLGDGTLRVVDYKTGTPKNAFGGLDALFSGEARERNPAALQTLLYALMLSSGERGDVQPTLYYVREMNREGFSPLLLDRGQPVLRFAPYRDGLVERLRAKVGELFDRSVPFVQCEDRKVCEYCDFREICRR
ncbi:MAG: PD-(D/E)XK nuclease family protein [Rikenellaceae bacterium]|nr:PD-(D/E)XK nuclease family protein [Rikenellaceae bacterium]